MEIEFLGVGEAFEPQLGNASFILKSQSWLMVDCGYGVPRVLFERGYNPNKVDAIYLTHFHADHIFGLPAVLNYWKEEGRTKPLTLIGQQGLEQLTTQLLELGYRGMQAKLPYSLKIIESDKDFEFQEWKLHFAETQHSIRNMAIKAEAQGVRVGISGDGGLSEASQNLFQDCQVLIHDAFHLNEPIKGHATAESVVSFARTLPQLKFLALVHINRRERQQNRHAFLALGKNCSFQLLIPEPREVLELS